MHKVKKLEIAEDLDFYSLTYNNTRETLRKLLEDPKYSTNIEKLSKQFKDQKETPLERAIWWIEYILRNPGNNHMHSPIHNLGLIVGNSFDIIAFETIIIIFIAYTLFRILYKKLFQQNDKNSNKKPEKHAKQS